MTAMVRVVNFTAATSTGNQDITHSDLTGLTGRAAILICQGNRTSASVSPGDYVDPSWSYGLWDGTNEAAVAYFGLDNDGSNGSSSHDSTTKGAYLVNTRAGASEYAGDISGISGGIRINVTDAAASAYLCTAIIFADDDNSIKADLDSWTVVDNSAESGSVSLTHSPEFFCCVHKDIYANAGNGDGGIGIGMSFKNTATGSWQTWSSERGWGRNFLGSGQQTIIDTDVAASTVDFVYADDENNRIMTLSGIDASGYDWATDVSYAGHQH